MSEGHGANGKQELKITFDSMRDKNIEQLKVLNNVLFPIRYQASEPVSGHSPELLNALLQQESYYRDCLASEEMSQFGRGASFKGMIN